MTGTKEQPLIENGHEFATGASIGFRPDSVLYDKHLCLQCGVVRRLDGNNGQCKGKVRVTVRTPR